VRRARIDAYRRSSGKQGAGRILNKAPAPLQLRALSGGGLRFTCRKLEPRPEDTDKACVYPGCAFLF